MAHLEPGLFREEYGNKVNQEEINSKKLKEYNVLLMTISQACKKVLKYELYFSEFYPSCYRITNSEALEHHIHAYLEDVVILKNKLTVFLGVLKNDLKKIAVNKKEIDKALTFFIRQTEGCFKGISTARDPHHHKGVKFIDSDIIDSEFSHTILTLDEPMKATFNSEFLEKLKKREVGSFLKAKTRWIETARKNNEQISGLINEIFERNNNFIYNFLGIKKIVKSPIPEFNNQKS